MRSSLRELKSSAELAVFMGVRPKSLNYYAYGPDKPSFYSEFTIKKRTGGNRIIKQPNPNLKYLQRLVHELMRAIYGRHPSVHGFVKGQSVITHALQHVNRKYLLKLDFIDYFPSITRRRIFGRLLAAPYDLHPKVAHAIASIATDENGRLPQGSPCSPVIANIITAEFDSDVVKIVKVLNVRYSRYADDLVFSSDRDMHPSLARYPRTQGLGPIIVGEALKDLISEHGFEINYRKTRLYSSWTRQLCTGIIVNNSALSLPRIYLRNLRAAIHTYSRDGWEAASERIARGENRDAFASEESLKGFLGGRLAWASNVMGDDHRTVIKLQESFAGAGS